MRLLRAKRKIGKTKYKKLLGNEYLRKILALERTIPNWTNLFSISNEDQRMEALVRINVIGTYLTNKYAWAIPSNRALKILENFQPLVEIGCGLAYWSRLLQDMGVDIIAIDTFRPTAGCWTHVIEGGPTLLRKEAVQSRNLFLSYPDESSELGLNCLKYFTGEYVIHVGELFITGTCCGGEQRPWGRTSSAAFQVKLNETFHCILTYALPSYPISRDYLTVWKRTGFVAGREFANGSEDDVWAAVPNDERMNIVGAAECVRHLLQ